MSDLQPLISRSTNTDTSLIERQQAFDEIINRFHGMAYGYAYAILGDFTLAQDASQEAFLIAWQQIRNLREPEAFPAWLRRLVSTQCNRLYRTPRVNSVPMEEATELPSTQPLPATALEGREVQEQIRLAIGDLPEHEKLVVALYYFGEHTQADIANFLELPVGTVKKRLHTARIRLRKAMSAIRQDESKTQSISGEIAAQIKILVETARSGAIERCKELLLQSKNPQELLAELCRAGHFQRISQATRRVVQKAQEEANATHSPTVEPVHLLLGLMRNEGIAGQILSGAGLTIERLSKRVAAKSEPSKIPPPTLPLSADAERMLLVAGSIARELQRAANLPPDIQPEHLLVALSENIDSPLATIFQEYSLTSDRLRAQLANYYRLL